jgi:hypothetical protein
VPPVAALRIAAREEEERRRVLDLNATEVARDAGGHLGRCFGEIEVEGKKPRDLRCESRGLLFSLAPLEVALRGLARLS